MKAEILLQAAALGLMQGGVYALVAAGLTLIYGVMNIVNFAHGEFVTLGMYLALFGFATLGIDPYAFAPLVVIAVFLLGLAIHRLCIQPALDHPQINQMLITIGVSTVVIGLMQMLWGANMAVIRTAYAREALSLGSVRITYTRLIAFAVAMMVTGGFWYFLKHTKLGMAIRAVAQAPSSALLVGIDVAAIQRYTFALGLSLAALAGALVGSIFFINPTVGIDLFLLPAFVIVVLGTMGNFIGALVGGIIIGLVEALAGVILGASLRQLASLTLFVLILLFMPRGLFGGRRR
ncbi:MAG: branched-chain amino acid ABC transporter permease [Gammaproteobacteria bacterium]